MKTIVTRGAGFLVLAASFLSVFAQERTPAKLEVLRGKVVPLAEWLEARGAKLDADATPYWLALVTDDGRVYPLVKAAPARMLFQDKSLQNRPMQITGRLLPGSDLLQAVNIHSVKDGKLHDVYFWCEVCIIKGYEKVICECCGAPMEFREVPVK